MAVAGDVEAASLAAATSDQATVEVPAAPLAATEEEVTAAAAEEAMEVPLEEEEEVMAAAAEEAMAVAAEEATAAAAEEATAVPLVVMGAAGPLPTVVATPASEGAPPTVEVVPGKSRHNAIWNLEEEAVTIDEQCDGGW